MKSTQLEMYLNKFNGRLKISILSKNNLNLLLDEFQKQTVGLAEQDPEPSSIIQERFVNFTSFGIG
jgi:hypothetical protein